MLLFEIKCERCGAAAIKTQSHARFCSRRCKEVAHQSRLDSYHRAIKRANKTCSVCAAPLPFHRSKFCSKACKAFASVGRYYRSRRCRCGAAPRDAYKQLCAGCFAKSQADRDRRKLERRRARWLSSPELREQTRKQTRKKYWRNRQQEVDRRRQRRIDVSAAKQLFRELNIIALPQAAYSEAKNEATRLWDQWSSLLFLQRRKFRISVYKYISEILALRGVPVHWQTVSIWCRKKQRRKRINRQQERRHYRAHHRDEINVHRRKAYQTNNAILAAVAELTGKDIRHDTR